MSTVHISQSIDKFRVKPRAPHLVIRANKGWTNIGLADVWRFRDLLWFLTLREIRARHRQTALGSLWFILRPVITMVVFSAVFGGLAKLPSEGVPYPLFTYAALLPWTYFAGATPMAVGSLTSRMDIISKVYFPRLIIPLSAVFTNLVEFAASFVVLIGMMIYYGYGLRLGMLWLPFYTFFTMMTVLAIGLWGATLAVKYRDIVLGITFIMQTWMFVTPVAYSASLIPARWRFLYELNPLFWVVEGFRWALFGTGQPPQAMMLIPLAATVILLISGAYVFRRTERTIVDLL